MKHVASLFSAAFAGLLTGCLVPSVETDGGIADRAAAGDGALRTDAASNADQWPPRPDANVQWDAALPDQPPPPPFDATPPDLGPHDAGPPPPNCAGGGPCAEGYYCDRNSCTDVGQCVLLPSSWVCMMQGVDHQCGCDGVTYGNGCALAYAQAAFDHAGDCLVDAGPPPDAALPDAVGAPCTGPNAVVCGQANFCDRLGCSTTSATACAPIPTTCPATSAPVCGCDGRTYDNDCLRRQTGFGLDHDGACTGAAPAACSASAPCANNLVCDRRSCASDATGSCVPQPGVCNGLSQLLCTCIGRTYDNVCSVVSVGDGQAIDHAGACQ